MARAEKVAAVAELTERFQTSAGAVLTEYRGLSVAQLGDLRQALGAHATFSVVKNTLTKIAAADAGVADDLTEMLSGPSAIAFVSGDVVEAAKGLRDFSKANPFLVIKGGVLDGKMLTPAEIVRLADLESREVLLAKLAGAMKATMSGAAATFVALPVQMARLLAALEEKRSDEAPNAEAAAPAEPAAEAEPVATGELAATGEPSAAAEPAATGEPSAAAEPAAAGEPEAAETDTASGSKDG
jgi:large subunit ribosomal protein L10